MVMKMVWACFDRTDFAILGIVLVLYSVPVYLSPAGGSKNFPAVSTSKSLSYTPLVTRFCLSTSQSLIRGLRLSYSVEVRL